MSTTKNLEDDLRDSIANLDRLKQSLVSLKVDRKHIAAKLQAAEKQIEELEGSPDLGRGGLIKSAADDITLLKSIIGRQSLPRVIWSKQPSRFDDTPREYVVIKTTPKRIYIGPRDSTHESYYSRDDGKRDDSGFYGIIDVAATLGQAAS